MTHVVRRVTGAAVGAAAGAPLGLLLGAFFGGNLASGFEFRGLRGYEATGQLGLLLGAAIGAALGAAVARGRRANAQS
ncbi:hypothetical protein BE04_04745 [Sorangium cellulosum]|uniref:Uncharacterized protein n=2 Tax=Sorangium cellulosum TaxID=56 RepID=A0A150TY70_SORCE|nr:hypothetical protein [Sorangium cellulosum]AGP40997.1 hypothetical protein SCE1572_44785 [Sorangium cellulosum So0157-2]KYF59882.1 hypothetical protein BE04_04745 [Sorangium cellulosum]KYG09649.1 hypothetical protein BE21_16690 [Sorangium cellulosum]